MLFLYGFIVGVIVVIAVMAMTNSYFEYLDKKDN